ncbi:hypothetical protein C2G38_2171090 [Gigaspora rosea]|uniref:Uncharacterized protein n=1 Tax=Gigaspora rosea TaxID=44941 RepID=A0A397VQG6_9GLOM|nr:hypothetical protein C2G38_2171090 [Gigaspora rosea]
MSQKVPSVIEKTQEDLKKDAKIRELWMKNICDHDKHTKFKIKETYDFIITGGPNVHANGLISLPCTWFKAFQLYDCDWGYVTQEQK